MNRSTTFALVTALTSAGLALAVVPSRSGPHTGSLPRGGSTHGGRKEPRVTVALRGFAEAFDIDLDELVQKPAARPVLVASAASGSR